jgi:hypothetical protein
LFSPISTSIHNSSISIQKCKRSFFHTTTSFGFIGSEQASTINQEKFGLGDLQKKAFKWLGFSMFIYIGQKLQNAFLKDRVAGRWKGDIAVLLLLLLLLYLNTFTKHSNSSSSFSFVHQQRIIVPRILEKKKLSSANLTLSL